MAASQSLGYRQHRKYEQRSEESRCIAIRCVSLADALPPRAARGGGCDPL